MSGKKDHNTFMNLMTSTTQYKTLVNKIDSMKSGSVHAIIESKNIEDKKRRKYYYGSIIRYDVKMNEIERYSFAFSRKNQTLQEM